MRYYHHLPRSGFKPDVSTAIQLSSSVVIQVIFISKVSSPYVLYCH